MNSIWILQHYNGMVDGVFDSRLKAELHVRKGWKTLFAPGSKGEPVFKEVENVPERVAILNSIDDTRVATLSRRTIE